MSSLDKAVETQLKNVQTNPISQEHFTRGLFYVLDETFENVQSELK